MPPIEIFFCYSHKDDKSRQELTKHLSILKRQGVISDWHDRKILPGSEWDKEIDDHVNTASIILLLISADFLNSDYCYDKEMGRALQRHETGEARVIPIILRHVDWKGALFAKLQALPIDGISIDNKRWKNRDEAFENVTRGIRAAVEAIRAKEDQADKSGRKKAKTAGSESMKVFIACDNLGDKQIAGILSRTGNSLNQSNIRNVIADPVRESLPLTISPIIAICQTSKGNPFKNIKKYVNLEHKSLIQILLPGGNKAELPLRNAPIFDLTADSSEEIDRLVEFIKAGREK